MYMCESELQNADNSAHGIFKRLCRTLADSRRDVRAYSATFTSLKSNQRRVEFAYTLVEEVGLFPELVVRAKSAALALQFRQEGNQLFKAKKDASALVKYTKSIAHAPGGSEDLALAFANRSAVLYEHKLYKECLKDISNAFSNSYPAHLHEKLLQRKEKAIAAQASQLHCDYHEALPQLTHEPNNFIECAGDCVQVKFEKNLGRHVVATKDLAVGDVIAIERPFARALEPKNYLTHCYHCLRPSYNLIACDNCVLALFCGENCKSTSWNATHKYECPILATLLNLAVNDNTLVALKICMLVEGTPKDFEGDALPGSSYKSQNYREIHNLASNTDLRSSTDLFERAVTAALIFELMQKHTQFFVENPQKQRDTFKDLLLLHMQTGATNFHEIAELLRGDDGCYNPYDVGAGAYAFLSLLNHSCCPNVVRFHYGDAIVLRALRPIAEGNQLFDNYGYHHAVMPKSERQEQLKKQYYFNCICEACSENWPLVNDLPEKHSQVEISEQLLTSLHHGDMEVARTAPADFEKMVAILEKLRPCKELAHLQEILKQCYGLLGNKRSTF